MKVIFHHRSLGRITIDAHAHPDNAGHVAETVRLFIAVGRAQIDLGSAFNLADVWRIEVVR